MLKSNRDSLTVGICLPSFRFAIDQNECHTDMSIADGIQPANAMSRAIFPKSQLKSLVYSGFGLNPFVKAETTAIIVDNARSTIINLIILSRTEYFPNATIIVAIPKIRIAQ